MSVGDRVIEKVARRLARAHYRKRPIYETAGALDVMVDKHWEQWRREAFALVNDVLNDIKEAQAIRKEAA